MREASATEVSFAIAPNAKSSFFLCISSFGVQVGGSDPFKTIEPNCYLCVASDKHLDCHSNLIGTHL